VNISNSDSPTCFLLAAGRSSEKKDYPQVPNVVSTLQRPCPD